MYLKINNLFKTAIFVSALFTFPIQAKPKAQTCQKMLKNIVTPLKKLSSFIEDKNKILPQYSEMMKLSSTSCSKRSEKANTIAMIRQYLMMKSHSLGVILPLSGNQQELGQSLLEGIKLGLSNNKVAIKLSVADTFSQPDAALRRFAELVLVSGVQSTVVHAPSLEAVKIEKYAHFLRIPTIFFSSSTKIKARSPYVMKVFPRASALAGALAKRLPAHDIKKIAMFIPEKQNQSTFVQYFEKSMKILNIEIDKKIIFNDTNYDQIDLAIKSILNIDPIERAEELSELIKTQQEIAEKRGEPFDATKVTLPPKVEYDALFIPHHISGLEHLTRMFQFHGLKDMILIGDQQWRAPELLTSHNPLFKHLLFADFIGNYNNLPTGLRAELKTTEEGNDHTLYDQDGYVINPQMALLTDFRLIGYLAGYALSSASDKELTTRFNYAQKILKTEMDPSTPFYKQGKIFNKYHHSNWPAFIFELKEQQLTAFDSKGQVIRPNTIAKSPYEIKKTL